MKYIEVSGAEISWERAFTHWSGWNKAPHLANHEFRLMVSFDYIEESFGPCWKNFIERESEVDDVELPNVYRELHDAGLPSLDIMLRNFPDLFCRLVTQSLQTEFIGFLVAEPRRVATEYFLQSMISLSAGQGILIIHGIAVCLRSN